MFSFFSLQRSFLLPLLAGTIFASVGLSNTSLASPDAKFNGVDIKNKLGERVLNDVPFKNSDGEDVTLASYQDDKHVLVVTLNFFECTSLCSVQLNEILKTISRLGEDWLPYGEKYRIVTISFDRRDTPELAKLKEEAYRKELVRMSADFQKEKLSDEEVEKRAEKIEWHFLTGNQKSIDATLDNMGYTVKWDLKTRQFAHSPVTYVLTPDGIIGRYLFNLVVPPNDFKFALMESSDGKLGTTFDKVLLSCFAYHDDGSYALAWGAMRWAAALALLILVTWLFFNFRRERRNSTLSSHSKHSESLT